MERLTIKSPSGLIHLKDNKELIMNTAIKKLAEYEDLEEQCIKQNSWCLRMLLHKWKEFIEDIQELYEYRKLEEQGRLLELPCAVGGTMYRIHKGTKLSPDRVYECKVVGVKQEYNTLSVKLHANINEETYSIWVDNWFDKCQIGHEFFLTEESAEAALKEMSIIEQVKELREITTNWNHNVPINPVSVVLNKAADTIESLSTKLQA